MPRQNSTAIAVVLDKSGSMTVVQSGTISGFNEFLANQKKVPGDATLTLVLFDTKYDVKYTDMPLKDIPDLNSSTYYPEGFTALNDAVAKTITELGQKLAAKPEHERPSKILVVIITDGLENSSKEYKNPDGIIAVKKMIKHQEEAYSWEFMYIGAGLHAMDQAQSLGIKTSNAAQYLIGNEKAVFGVLHSSVERGRGGQGQSVGYSIGERYSLMDDGSKGHPHRK